MCWTRQESGLRKLQAGTEDGQTPFRLTSRVENSAIGPLARPRSVICLKPRSRNQSCLAPNYYCIIEDSMST